VTGDEESPPTKSKKSLLKATTNGRLWQRSIIYKNYNYSNNKQTLQRADIKPLLTMKRNLSQIKKSRSSIQVIRQIPINTSRKHNFKAGTVKKHPGATRATPGTPLLRSNTNHSENTNNQARKSWAWPSHSGPLLGMCKPRSGRGGLTQSKVEAMDTETDSEQFWRGHVARFLAYQRRSSLKHGWKKHKRSLPMDVSKRNASVKRKHQKTYKQAP
jgi:hypothetical protein